MKRPAIIYFLLIILFISGKAQKLPEGYILQYEQNFSSSQALNDFHFTNPQYWGIFKEKDNFYLQFAPDTTTNSSYNLPATIGILQNHIFGDFILEANIMVSANSSENHEFCIFLGVKDSFKFYYIQLADTFDGGRSEIYVVKNSPAVNLTGDDIPAISWGNNKWHKIRIERDIVKRTIVVFFDDFSKPYMEVKNYELVLGSIGFGSFHTVGRVDNIKIWSQTVIPDLTPYYEGKE